MFHQRDAMRSDPASKPSCEAVGGEFPLGRQFARSRERHFGRHPYRRAAGPQSLSDRSQRRRRNKAWFETANRRAKLLHRQQRHVMRRAVVKTHLRLRLAHLVGEGSAAGHDNRAPSAAGERR